MNPTTVASKRHVSLPFQRRVTRSRFCPRASCGRYLCILWVGVTAHKNDSARLGRSRWDVFDSSSGTNLRVQDGGLWGGGWLAWRASWSDSGWADSVQFLHCRSKSKTSRAFSSFVILESEWESDRWRRWCR